MSIFKGKSGSNIPVIKRGERNVNYVFKGEYMIWPSVFSSCFWYSLNPDSFISQSKPIEHDSSAGTQKVYIRSSNKSYTKKYSFKIESDDDWIYILDSDGNAQSIDSTSGGYDIKLSGASNQYVPDYILEVGWNANQSTTSKTGAIKFTQYDEDGNLIDNFTFTLGVELGGDQASGKGDFSSAKVYWYSDEKGTNQVLMYAETECKNALTNVFFKIEGTITTNSGSSMSTCYGERDGETLDTSNLYASSYVDSIKNINYVGSGIWSATICWQDNIGSSNDLKNVTGTVLNVLPADVDGGYAEVQFQAFVKSTTSKRETLLNISLPSSSIYDGTLSDSVEMSQAGGTLDEEIVNNDEFTFLLMPTSTVDWIPVWDGKPTYNGNYWSIKTLCNAQSSTTKTIVPKALYVNGTETDFESIPSSASGETYHSLELEFEIYEVSPSSTKRSVECSIWARRVGTSMMKLIANTTLSQNGRDASSSTKITTNNGKYSVISYTSDNTYPDYTNMVWAELQINSNGLFSCTNRMTFNSKIVDDEVHISNLTVSAPVIEYVALDNNTGAIISCQLTSGESNSSPRSFYTVVIENRNSSVNAWEDDNVIGSPIKMKQLGSTDASSMVYHDGEVLNNNCTNTTDNLSCTLKQTASSSNNHTYQWYMHVAENKMKDTSNILEIVPENADDITLWLETLNPESGSTTIPFTISGKGYPYYKGVSRPVSFKVTYGSDSSKISITQNGNDTGVKGDTKIDIDSFDISDLDVSSSVYDGTVSLGSSLSKDSSGNFQGSIVFTENTSFSNYIFEATVDNNSSETQTIDASSHQLVINGTWYGKAEDKTLSVVLEYTPTNTMTTHDYNVEFTGNIVKHSTVNTDYSISVTNNIQSSSFYNLSNNTLYVSANTSDSASRGIIITVSTKNCPTSLSKKFTVTQQPNTQTIYNLTTSSNKIIIREIDGSLATQTLTVCSQTYPSDNKTNISDGGLTLLKTEDWDPNWTYSITQNSSKGTGYYNVTVKPKITNRDGELWHGKLTLQNKNGNTIVIDVYQYAYILEVNFADGTSLTNKGDVVKIEVDSYYIDEYNDKAIVELSNVYNTNSSLTIYYKIEELGDVSYSITGTLNSDIPSGTSRISDTICIEQDDSYEETTVSIFGNRKSVTTISDINLYKANDTGSWNVYYKINGTNQTISMSPTTFSDTSLVSVSGASSSGTSISPTFTLNSVYESDTYLLTPFIFKYNNNQFAIGNVIVHGFKFYESENNYDISLPSTTTPVVLTIESKMDGDYTTWTISNTDTSNYSVASIPPSSTTPISISVAAKSSNDTVSTKTYKSFTLTQTKSGKTLTFNVKQLGNSDKSLSSSSIDFYYQRTATVTLNGYTSSDTVTSSPSWCTISFSSGTLSVTPTYSGETTKDNVNGAKVAIGTSSTTGTVKFNNGLEVTVTLHRFQFSVSDAVYIDGKGTSAALTVQTYMDGSYHKLLTTNSYWTKPSASWISSCTITNASSLLTIQVATVKGTSGTVCASSERSSSGTLIQPDSLLAVYPTFKQHGYSISDGSDSTGCTMNFYKTGSQSHSSLNLYKDGVSQGFTSSDFTVSVGDTSWCSASLTSTGVTVTVAAASGMTMSGSVWNENSKKSTTVTITHTASGVTHIINVVWHGFVFYYTKNSSNYTIVSRTDGSSSNNAPYSGSATNGYISVGGSSYSTTVTSQTGSTFYIIGTSSSSVTLTQNVSGLTFTISGSDILTSWTAHNS